MRFLFLMIFCQSLILNADLKSSFNNNDYFLNIKLGEIHRHLGYMAGESNIIFHKNIPYLSEDNIIDDADDAGTCKLYARQGAASYFIFSFPSKKLLTEVRVPVTIFADQQSRKLRIADTCEVSIYLKQELGSVMILNDINPVFRAKAEVKNLMLDKRKDMFNENKGSVIRDRLSRYISVGPNGILINERGIQFDEKSLSVIMSNFYKSKDLKIFIITEKGIDTSESSKIGRTLNKLGYTNLEYLNENKQK